MPRHGENIFKRKDGRWEGRYISSYNENGKAIYKSVYSKTYADTKRKLEVAKNSNLNLRKSTTFNTFSDLLNYWLEFNSPKTRKQHRISMNFLLKNILNLNLEMLKSTRFHQQ